MMDQSASEYGAVMPVVDTLGTATGLWIAQVPGDARVFDNQFDAETWRKLMLIAIDRVSKEE